ncbi:hypothetical protein MSG28_004748 [Choristoneura fumiferana]|uniref:Uncharacterized protein n=1 Tax=Choristoneura fumiferana TaxID=7141 RepID=A0ACC0K7A0_CHOFU|nr:hypothetical protein MSG28_004748 [Choristoneura fumiferana]
MSGAGGKGKPLRLHSQESHMKTHMNERRSPCEPPHVFVVIAATLGTRIIYNILAVARDSVRVELGTRIIYNILAVARDSVRVEHLHVVEPYCNHLLAAVRMVRLDQHGGTPRRPHEQQQKVARAAHAELVVAVVVVVVQFEEYTIYVLIIFSYYTPHPVISKVKLLRTNLIHACFVPSLGILRSCSILITTVMMHRKTRKIRPALGIEPQSSALRATYYTTTPPLDNDTDTNFSSAPHRDIHSSFPKVTEDRNFQPEVGVQEHQLLVLSRHFGTKRAKIPEVPDIVCDVEGCFNLPSLGNFIVTIGCSLVVGPCARFARIATTILLANPAVKQQCLHCCVSAWRKIVDARRGASVDKNPGRLEAYWPRTSDYQVAIQCEQLILSHHSNVPLA